jgi:hypothetical protein
MKILQVWGSLQSGIIFPCVSSYMPNIKKFLNKICSSLWSISLLRILMFCTELYFNETLEVFYNLHSYKKRVKLNRPENKLHSLDDFRSNGNTKLYKKFSLTSKIKNMKKTPALYVSLVYVTQNKHIKTLVLKGINELWKDSRLIYCVLTEVISAIIPPSLFAYTITGSLTLNNLPSNIVNNFTITRDAINVFVTILSLALRKTTFCQNISNNFTTCVTEQSLVTILVTILPAALKRSQQSH